MHRALTVTADGRLSPCCGLVDRKLRIFRAGDVLREDTVEVMERCSASTVYNWLALEGPGAIRDFVNTRRPLFRKSARYVQACQLCQEIFSNSEALTIILGAMPLVGASLAMKRCAFEAAICASRSTRVVPSSSS